MKSTREQKMILGVVLITAFLTTFMGSALNLSIPRLETEFQAGATLIGWVVTAYTLSVAAMSVPFGKIADITGRRKILLAGIGLFAVFSLLCAMAQNMWMLLLLRVLQGIFASMIFATNNAILISSYPAEQRGRVLGLSTAAVYVGLSAGPVAGGFLNHYAGWRSIFVVTAVIAVTALLLGIKNIPQKENGGEKLRPDGAGNFLYIASVTVTLYGLSSLSVLRYGWLIFLAGLVLGAAFVYVEMRAENPVIRISMFTKDAAFTLSNLAALLNYGATFAISYLMSIYLQVVMGFSSQTAGLILIAQPVMQALFSPMMGRLSDRIAPYKLASAGMGFCVAGLIMFFLVDLDTDLWFIVAALVFSGFGFALFSSPNTNAIMACVEKRDYSVANSILATMRTVGQSSSMAVVTVVVGFTMGNTSLDSASPAALVHTMHIAFLIFIVLCILGVFMSLKRGKEKAGQGE
ncbi:MAG: MFS transporter [Emergencia sp.]